MTFDSTKPCTTRDGRKVRLFTERMTDGRLAGVIVNQNGNELLTSWFPNGANSRYLDSNRDLINTPEKRTVWVNFYRDGNAGYHNSRESTDWDAKRSLRTRLACVKVEFEEGEGL